MHSWFRHGGRLGLLVAVAALADGAAAQERKMELHKLFAEYDEWQLREFPELAMSRGDYRYADRITDGSLAAIERRHAERQRFLERLHAIDADALNEDDRLNYDLFEQILSRDIEGHRFRMFLAPIHGRSGPQQEIPQMHERVRFASYDDFANYLKRLEQTPRAIDHTLELLRLGLKEGRTPPRVTLAGVPGQFQALLGDDKAPQPGAAVPHAGPERGVPEPQHRSSRSEAAPTGAIAGGVPEPQHRSSRSETAPTGAIAGGAPTATAGGGRYSAIDQNRGGLRVLATPFARAADVLTPEQRAELRKRFEETSLPAARDGLRKLGEFVTREYIPRCRESIAAIDLPDGRAYYAFMLRTMTTTDLTAEQIHEIGLREVERIRAEMMEVIRASDFLTFYPDFADLDDGELFRAFIYYLRQDERFYPKSPADLMTGYRDICKRVDAILPRLFKKLPRLPYGVREIPAFMAPSQTTAYYQPGDIRNAEPGYFYANTYALDQRPRYEMIALAMHEAVPGHHLQIALAQELEHVPEFRKEAWFNAFGEGWALYSERLGLEHGLYDDPYDNFGRLLYEMWRACRLVVDPGMHALGWSRDQAVSFMQEHTALSELNIHNEIDRYIAWPGQACAYKIGELKIRALRERAEAALREHFDLREFHDLLLSAGSIPLNLLEKRVEAWIARKQKGPAAAAKPD